MMNRRMGCVALLMATISSEITRAAGESSYVSTYRERTMLNSADVVRHHRDDVIKQSVAFVARIGQGSGFRDSTLRSSSSPPVSSGVSVACSRSSRWTSSCKCSRHFAPRREPTAVTICGSARNAEPSSTVMPAMARAVDSQRFVSASTCDGSRGCLIRRRSTASVLAPVVGRGAGRLLNHVPSLAVELWSRCAGVVTRT